jgi:hypothetical protein
MLFKVCWKLGVRADYRKAFWGYAWPRLKEGRIEEIIATGIIAKHLITFAQGVRRRAQCVALFEQGALVRRPR